MAFYIQEDNYAVMSLAVEWQGPSFLELTSFEKLSEANAAEHIGENLLYRRMRFVNCELSTEKKIQQQQQPSNSDQVITSVNSNRIKGKG